MEVYPFHHQNLFFNIITDYDLAFKEVRKVLDHLLKVEAFKQEDFENGKFYEFQIDNIQYEIDVNGYEVIIYRRTDL